MTNDDSSQPYMPRRASAKSALRAILSFGGFFLASAATAQTPSVETAAKAAGLPVKSATANVNQIDLYYRDVGAGDQTVILLHGFPETGDALAPAVAALGARYRLIIPDLRGFGRSQRPTSGYDKKTVATDIKLLIDQLGVERVDMVGYDIGARVAYAFALQYPERLRSLTVAEAFIEGLPGTAQFKQIAPTVPRLKHFAEFADADGAEQRYLGKEDVYPRGRYFQDRRPADPDHRLRRWWPRYPGTPVQAGRVHEYQACRPRRLRPLDLRRDPGRDDPDHR